MKLKSALALDRHGWRAVIDNALTGLSLALFAAGVSAFGVWLGA